MPAYFLVDILEITDEDKMEQYRAKVFDTVQSHGGAYRVLGGQYEVAEGEWTLNFPVLIEFPTFDQAKKWYDSDEYRAILKLRTEGSRCNAMFLPGMEETIPSE